MSGLETPVNGLYCTSLITRTSGEENDFNVASALYLVLMNTVQDKDKWELKVPN